ncbi:diguanylate cyclase domain-containing protein [Clostridium arbusti]|uniref:diguanylate cyclase domain-containing protein n=1 Tax=Clostridium arbusti TaxID=1137848 RepID=UPI000288C650|nr:diguanylate cyclase [Clostridium arbusti]
MFFLSSLSLICSCIYFYMAIHTFNLKKNSISTKLFLISCASMFIWSFSYGFFYISTGTTQTTFSKISSFGWCYSPAIFLHLSLAFTRNRFIKKTIINYILYIPGTIFVFIRLFFISSDELTSSVLLNLFYKSNFIYNLSFTTLCCLILLMSSIKTTSIKEKKQNKIIILTGLFSYASNIIMQYTLSIYGLHNIPQIGQILNLAVFGGIYYSIINYELFEIPPSLTMRNQSSENKVYEHKKTEQQLKESEERFKIMFYKHASIMYIFDSETLYILDVNDAATRFYGYSYEKFKTMKITEINIFDESTIKNIIKEVYINDTIPYKTKHILSNCTIKDVEIHASPITFNNKNMIFCIINDITEQNKNDKYISFLAYHDSLTGLPNRKLFYIKLEQALFDAKVNNKILAVLYIDLDGFKLINDTYGHQTGDFMLCAASKKLKHSIRKNDILARIGGDEFTLLLYDIDSYENAELVVQKLLSKLNKPIIKNNIEFFINASIGISIYPHNGKDINSLIKNADHNMYEIKRQKKMS